MKPFVVPFGDGTVTLRLVKEPDLKTLLDWRNRDDARIWFKTSDKISWESHLAWYRRYLKKRDDLFFLVEVDEKPAGQCAIYDIDHQMLAAEVGRFLVAPGMSGRGFMRRACNVLAEYGARELGIRYFYLEVFEKNARAMHVYESCGFREEGRNNGLVKMSQTVGHPR